MQAVIKIEDVSGASELKVATLEELAKATADFDRAGIDYTIDYRKI